jgi:hypothetical protein
MCEIAFRGISIVDAIFIITYTLIFILILKYSEFLKKPYIIYIIGIAIIILSNLLQGFPSGLSTPVEAEIGYPQIQYYSDAIKIDNAYDFIRDYNTIQPHLLVHSSTHPPGAVLTYYALNSVFHNKILISISLLAISLLSVFYVYRIIARFFNKQVASYTSLIFIFLPAIQIYYLSSLDGLIAFTFIGSIYHYIKWNEKSSVSDWLLCIAYLSISAFLTYITAFLFALIFIHLAYEKICVKKNTGRAFIENTLDAAKKYLLLIAPFASVFLIIYLFSGFNYISGFLTASRIENSNGPLIISNTASYMVTRLECVAEIILFLGPVATFLAYQGTKQNSNKLIQFSKFSIILLLIVFIAGSYRTGETARACLFIYPFLLIFLANFIYSNNNVKSQEIRQILSMLWIQSTIMQIFGFYFW